MEPVEKVKSAYAPKYDEVFIPTRRINRRSADIDLAADSKEESLFACQPVRTFSKGLAVRHLYGCDSVSSCDGASGVVDAEQEQRCQKKKKLLTMRARAECEDTSNVIQQEDLEDWLDSLQLRLHQACHVSAERRRNTTRLLPEQRTTSCNVEASPTFKGNGHHLRCRSISVVAENAAAALTDSRYLEQVQNALQQASISSLHERLAERKVKENVTVKVAVRPKIVLDKGKNRKKSTAKAKCTLTDGSESCISSYSHTPWPAEQNRDDEIVDRIYEPAATTEPTSRSVVPTPKHSFFDNSQKVDDIYRAAETLILPPARQEAVVVIASAVSEDVEAGDFWTKTGD